MITARGGGGNGRAALRSRTMCSLRTVIAQAAVMGNIYRLADYPVILMPGGAADAAVPHGRLGTEPRRNRQSTCPDRNPIRQVTCGSYGHQAACASVDQAVEYRLSADHGGAEIGHAGGGASHLASGTR
jgi:hypothetical protein